jgi:putative membrane-bound dehydrogenase-like protein
MMAVRRFALVPFLLSALASAFAHADEIALNGHMFTLPAGFTIDVIAKDPVVKRPITGAFDEQGRLYVADSSGSNDPVRKQLVDRPHRILRLEDTDGAGRFDHQTIFADKMMFPEGTMWLDGSLYVSAPPTIWKLTDTNGDGVADRREEWLTKTAQHCANDLHGPYLGLDGWIYWCKGAFERQTYERPGKKPFVTRAAHIFRARPDGSQIEPVMTGGMDNPVDVTFTPGGERIFSCTFLVHPSDGQRDGLIHAIYGGVYGKPHGVIDGHKRTGDLMPPLVHLGPAAPCGLTRYESASFGPEYRDNLFTCSFNMHKVTRSTLMPHGATFHAKTDDFLVSNSLDFHPTDVIEDADGSLIVIDTGGWYKLCCPTSQLWKPDILGAIYRVRRKDAPHIDDPRGLKMIWTEAPPAELAKRLDDRRPAIRNRAVQELGKRGPAALPALEERLKGSSADARRNAVWTLTRIDGAPARAAVRTALNDPDAVVRQAAIHSISLWRDGDAVIPLVRLLSGASYQNRRAAAEALGHIGDRTAVSALLEATVEPMDPIEPSRSGKTRGVRAYKDPADDRILEHSLIYALIDIDDPAATRLAIESDRPRKRRAALIALDQMDGGGLQPEKVAALLASRAPVLRETASWIIGRHSDWGGALAGSLRERLHARGLAKSDRAELERHLTQFAGNASVQQLIGAALAEADLSISQRRTLLVAIRNSGLKEMPSDWVNALLRIIGGTVRTLAADVVAALHSVPAPKALAAEATRALLNLADDRKADDSLRLNALAAVPGGLTHVSQPNFDFLRKNLNTDLPVATRSAAAEVLSKAKLTNGQLLALTDSFQSIGPLEADRLLAAFEGCADPAVGQKLVAALKTSPVLTSLHVDSIHTRIAKQPAAVQKKAEELYALINVDLAKQRQRIQDMLPLVPHGDIRRGQLVFARAKAACVACHQFGYIGGHIGPDLTSIGRIRSDRDLLEAILFPSASFVRSFEPLQVLTKSGKIVNGLVRKDAPDELVLVASATETVRVPRDEIEEMRPGTVSIMPAGLDKQLTPEELADLVAFLKNAK